MRRHIGILRRFEDILPKMEAANAPQNTSLNLGADNRVGSRLGDVMDLPSDMRAQLVSFQFNEADMQIVNLVNAKFDGVATIDEIFVGLFREHDVKSPRDALANKIYRMTRKELLFSVAGRKGVYTTQRREIEPETEKEA